MNNNILYRGIFLAVILAICGVASFAQATVGGPTLIHTFTYNPADESVYFIRLDQSGRGCPPILQKISLNTGVNQTVLSCDQGEALLNGASYPNFSAVNAEIQRITKDFKQLTPIDLNKNNIQADVNFVRTEGLTPEIQEITKTHFNTIVYEDNRKVAEFPIIGCNRQQPFVFAGYAIPGFDKKIVMLKSAKGDCWEGGYVMESLHVVGGLESIDKTYASDSHKFAEPLLPSVSTLIVYESDGVNVNATPSFSSNAENKNPQTTPPYPLEDRKSFETWHLVLAALVSLIAGLLLGRFIKGNSKA